MRARENLAPRAYTKHDPIDESYHPSRAVSHEGITIMTRHVSGRTWERMAGGAVAEEKGGVRRHQARMGESRGVGPRSSRELWERMERGMMIMVFGPRLRNRCAGVSFFLP